MAATHLAQRGLIGSLSGLMLIGARAAIVKSAPSADHIAGSSMKPLTLLAGPLLAFCACCAADGQMLEFGGFGTLGVAHSNNQQADYRADKPFAAKGPGRSADWDAGLDSKLGLQLDGQFGEQWSAVLQLVSERQSDARWQPTGRAWYSPHRPARPKRWHRNRT